MKDKLFLRIVSITLFIVMHNVARLPAADIKEYFPSLAANLGQVLSKPSNLTPFNCALITDQILEIKISYNQSLSLDFDYKELSQTNWSIYNANNNKLFTKGKGDKIFNVVFNKPGDFKIIFSNPNHKHEPGKCYHPTIPNQINLKVNSSHIVYKTETVTFSRPVLGGVDTKDVTLTIDVEVLSHSGAAVQIPTTITSAGVEAKMMGRLVEKQRLLPPGQHKINYILQGTLKKNTYIGFDFKDPNGNITSYYHKQKI